MASSASRVTFSGQHASLAMVALHYSDVRAGLFEFFAGNSPELLSRYAGSRVDEARAASLEELDFTSSLAVLSAVEAAVRIDYLRRVYAKGKDAVSRAMREIYQEKETRARLEDDLLQAWREKGAVRDSLVVEMTGAFKYRHWLAHGRYWSPKFGKVYDYPTVYQIAEDFLDAVEQY